MMSKKQIMDQMRTILAGFYKAVDEKNEQAIFQGIGNLHGLYWVLEGEVPTNLEALIMYLNTEGT